MNINNKNMKTGKITPKKTTTYTLIKENNKGGIKKEKNISEDRYGRIQNRFNKKGSATLNLGNAVSQTNNKSNTKRVIKTVTVDTRKIKSNNPFLR